MESVKELIEEIDKIVTMKIRKRIEKEEDIIGLTLIKMLLQQSVTCEHALRRYIELVNEFLKKLGKDVQGCVDLYDKKEDIKNCIKNLFEEAHFEV